MTTTKSIVGSPFYMSPEQLLSPRDVDARADVWALGVVLYELLSGEVPFSGESMPEVCARVLHASPPPLTPDRADLPDGLEQIITKCLAKDRADRYQSMAELATALSGLEGSGAGLPPRRSDRVQREGGISSAATTRDATPAPTVGRLSAGAATSHRALFAVSAVAATIGIFVVLGRAAGPAPSDARQGADPKAMTTATAIDVAPATASGGVAPPSASASAPAAPVLPSSSASARAAAPKPARALPRSAVAAAPPAATATIDDPFGDERK